jgi:hypothetical protein
MAEGAFVAYYRVSTERQGKSGLGLDAQRKAVEDFLNGGNWRLVAEFTEIESGKHSDRPALAKAFRACRLHGAKLVIAKSRYGEGDLLAVPGLRNDGARISLEFTIVPLASASGSLVGSRLSCAT